LLRHVVLTARCARCCRRAAAFPRQVLFSIPDIRLFWTDDPRFAAQFRPGELTTFKPYSKYPPCFKARRNLRAALPPTCRHTYATPRPQDISFWLPEAFERNDFFELGRSVAGELVEQARGRRHPRPSREPRDTAPSPPLHSHLAVRRWIWSTSS